MHVVLRDGRRLGYAESGDPDGLPLLWFPGTPGSRYSGPADEHATRSAGVRLICIERPGFGVSDFLARRQFLDCPHDVTQVADALGIDRFAIAGISGAGPYLAACAHEIPERLTAVGLISCIGPLGPEGMTKRMPMYRRGVLRVVASASRVASYAAELGLLGRDPEKLYRRMTRGLSAGDRAILARPEVWDRQVASIAEALRPGARGFVRELILVTQPWGFRLCDIDIEVHMWHGTGDRSTPIEMGRYMAEQIPSCEASFYPDEGHFLIYDRWAEIVSTLADAAASS